MNLTNNEEFARLSGECRRHLRAGMLDWFAFDLKEMGALLGKEGRYQDKLKVLMLAFYIDLSGACQPAFIDHSLTVSLTSAATESGLESYQIDELYMETVREDVTPRHVMTVKDSLYLLQLCIAGKREEAEKLLADWC